MCTISFALTRPASLADWSKGQFVRWLSLAQTPLLKQNEGRERKRHTELPAEVVWLGVSWWRGGGLVWAGGGAWRDKDWVFKGATDSQRTGCSLGGGKVVGEGKDLGNHSSNS